MKKVVFATGNPTKANRFSKGLTSVLHPGLFVLRINGKTLNADEMIKHYINLVKKYGTDGKLDCK